ncbi:hypothetical protein A7311_04515 [Paenibacillus polymyxa]|uniref:glutaredoxin family protein n=1 Tax=Paenibacillus TaxID=44249 RepID=UPI00083D1BFC|nr:glutaredoxin family protein [Paenibacillus polymyxa]MBP1307716.1 glutaredoxin [Paenibacillus sp. 1182]ODB53610.1 hypothetical protein A7311_04515 [Paenibacillus polymyxa]
MLNEVLIYTKSNCKFCQKIKEWMEDNKINFTDIDITNINDLKLLREIKGVPYTIIKRSGKETVICGFNPNKLRETLL